MPQSQFYDQCYSNNTFKSREILLNESSSLRENISRSEGNIRNKTKKIMSVVFSYAAFGIKH